jgi:hypothetical protein
MISRSAMSARFVLAALGLLMLAPAARSGTVLDDILNYKFVDQTVPMSYNNCNFNPTNTITLTSSAPIGQTFVAGMDVEKIVTIRLFLQPGSNWQPGEGAQLVVWDSPQKHTSLGSYTIWYEFRGYDYCVAEFEVNAPVTPGKTYYMELSYAGTGDGVLCPVGTVSDQSYVISQRVIYVNGAAVGSGGDGKSWQTAFKTIGDAINSMSSADTGRGYLAGVTSNFDLCFQTHGKRRIDRTGSLRKMFARFDLTRPELASIKQAVDLADYEAAIARTVAYFEARQTPVPIITSANVPHVNPSFNRSDGDNALQNKFLDNGVYAYVGPDLNWRPECDFDANGNIAGSSFSMNRSLPRWALGNAYLQTADDKYAVKLNSVYIDFFKDNPPPVVSKIGGSGPDDVWSSLNTGIRLGAEFTSYDYIHAPPSFSTDCRMAFIMNMADHADTLVWNGAFAGGNWSATQNQALLQFALDFPEFKNSALWLDVASQRILQSITSDILPDGVETESAPGYQRQMYYMPLLDIYKLLLARGVTTPFSAQLKAILEKQADYFMHLAMPNSMTPELGDWGDAEPWQLVDDSTVFNRPDMLYVGTRGMQGTPPTEISKCYPSSGIVTMRSDWGNVGRAYSDSRYLMCHGVHHGAHGHSDLNGITLYGYGREFLTDPGIYIYGSPQSVLLTSAVSHNLMTIDGQDQISNGDTPFRNWATTASADYLSSWLPCYSAGNYQRDILYVRSNGSSALDYWVIRDKAEGSGTHSIEQRWHFNPMTLVYNGSTSVRSSYSKGNLALTQVTPSRLQVQTSTTSSWRPRGTTGAPTQLPTVVYSANGALPAGIDTVLFPYPGSGDAPAQVQSIETASDGLGSVFTVTQGTVSDLIVMQRASGSRTVSSWNVSFNGERLVLREVNGTPTSAVLINGTSLTVNGQTVIQLAQPQPFYTYTF